MGREGLWVVLPAGGHGRRFGADKPKQYLTLLGVPMILHALRTLAAHPRVRGVQLALPAGDAIPPEWREFLGADREKLLPPVAGGAERADSVRNGLHGLLAHGAGPADWVLVHDAARPCLRREDLDALVSCLSASPQGAILAVPVADTLKREADGVIAATVERSGLWRAFTPQAFPLGALLDALENAARDGQAVTDEAGAMEALGWQPRLVRGHGDNIKVTLPEDLPLAEAILRARMGD